MATWRPKLEVWLEALSGDPLTKILLRESHLTEKQFKALLIDISSEETAQKRLSYTEKAQMAPGSPRRGAFNRTLMQGRRNVTRSLFTLYLLGYLGILDLASIEEHLQVGRRMREYVQLYRRARSGRRASGLDEKVLEAIHRELLDKVGRLAKPSSLKPKAEM